MDAVKVALVKEPSLVQQRLEQLGLDVETLHAALKAGLAERNACTENDPPGFGGMTAWAKTVRGLRELLIRREWKRTNRRRLAAVLNPEGTVAVGVSTGDERTGIDGPEPQTAYPKGPAWQAAVDANADQLAFTTPGMWPEIEPEREVVDDNDLNRATWVLLFYIAARETRCELSMPKEIGADSKKLDSWVERILLPSIPHDPEPAIEENAPAAEPIDVPVKRRVG
jgi:hypothetical protein